MTQLVLQPDHFLVPFLGINSRCDFIIEEKLEEYCCHLLTRHPTLIKNIAGIYASLWYQWPCLTPFPLAEGLNVQAVKPVRQNGPQIRYLNQANQVIIHPSLNVLQHLQFPADPRSGPETQSKIWFQWCFCWQLANVVLGSIAKIELDFGWLTLKNVCFFQWRM